MEWLQHVSPDRLIMLGFLLGVWFTNKSRTNLGTRMGQLEKDLTAYIAGKLPPPTDNPPHS